jgi:hypothetical protein
MNLERYEYIIGESLQENRFYSIGPNGKIGKLVFFTLQNLEGNTFLSLTFGNYTEDTGAINFFDVSDNEDKEKILATVFTIIIDFLNRFPDMLVYAIGSTVSRTRLYQMGINKYWYAIELILLVYGEHKGDWQPFEKNICYDAFLFAKKM